MMGNLLPFLGNVFSFAVTNLMYPIIPCEVMGYF